MRVIPICIIVLASVLPRVEAATVGYSLTALGADKWRCDHTVTNDLARGPIQEFTIMFTPGAFANLTLESSPAGWDSLAAAPDTALPAAGFFDSMALPDRIAAGQRLAGFSVSFDYLAPGTPGAQAYDIVDPSSFAVLASGVSMPISAVPENSGLAMWLIGAMLLGTGRAARAARSFPEAAVAGRAA